jgi:hypothetical protein
MAAVAKVLAKERWARREKRKISRQLEETRETCLNKFLVTGVPANSMNGGEKTSEQPPATEGSNRNSTRTFPCVLYADRRTLRTVTEKRKTEEKASDGDLEGNYEKIQALTQEDEDDPFHSSCSSSDSLPGDMLPFI